MSEFSESYYLRTEQRDNAIQLLTRAQLHGYVFAPSHGWVQMLADGPQIVPNERLLDVNDGILLHYVYSDDYGVILEVYERREPRFRFGSEGKGDVVTDATGSHVEQLGKLLDLTTAQVRDFESIAFGRGLKSADEDPPIAYRLARILGLQNFEWLDYGSFARGFDDEPTDSDVVEIDPPEEDQSPSMRRESGRQFESIPPFPKILCGNAAKVRRAARKLIKNVWAADSWADEVRELEAVPFDGLSETILIEASPLHISTGEVAWRLGDIGGAFYGAYADSTERGTKEGHSKYHRLLLEGMRSRFWVTVALLNHEVVFAPHGSVYDYATVCRDVLNEFVQWLPEIVNVSSCLVDYLGGGVSYPSWALRILHVALNAGWETDVPTLSRVYGGDVVRAMLSDGVIEMFGSRYQLSDSFTP